MYPQHYPGSEWGEEQVFEALETLSDEWHVIADAFFPVERRHQATLDGQVDFILLHRDHGALVLEVKGGRVEVDGGSWTSTNKDGTHQIKDPFKQASGYKHILRKLIKAETGISIWFTHAVAFPVVSRTAARIGTHSSDMRGAAGCQVQGGMRDVGGLLPASAEQMGPVLPTGWADYSTHPRERWDGASRRRLEHASCCCREGGIRYADTHETPSVGRLCRSCRAGVPGRERIG